MNKELQEKLYKKHPEIFKDHTKSMTETAMCWGFQHGDGWYKIIDELCNILDTIRQYTGISVIATTVKEKFGTLRFYVRYEDKTNWRIKLANYILQRESRKAYDSDIWIETIDQLIDQAEARSAYTCEFCGEPGKIALHHGYLATVCEMCAKKNDFKFEKEKENG